MSDKTKISWSEATWNPVTGCTRVSSGCDRCYAVQQTHRIERMTASLKTRDGLQWRALKEVGVGEKYHGLTALNGKGERHFNGVVRCHEDVLEKPLHWRKPRRIFVNSMSDLFHELVPDEFIYEVLAVTFLCQQHTFQILTKRPERMDDVFNEPGISGRISQALCRLRLPPHLAKFGDPNPSDPAPCIVTAIREVQLNLGIDPNALRKPKSRKWPPSNIWLGTSCEDQETLERRAVWVMKCPAAVRFLSLEPLLGPINLRCVLTGVEGGIGATKHFDVLSGLEVVETPFGRREYKTNKIDWIVVGGESGPGHRPCKIEWIESIVKQCRAAGVACFVKQDSGPRPGMQGRIPDAIWNVKEYPCTSPG